MHRRSLLPLAMLPWAGMTAIRAATPADAQVVLTIAGKLPERHAKAGRALTLSMLEAMQQTRYLAKTPWYGQARPFSGPLLRDLLRAAGVELPAVAQGPETWLRALAMNDYQVNIPLSDLLRYDVIVACRIDDRPIPLRERGPLMIMYPFDSHPELRNAVNYGRCAWQLHRLELL